jgi:hypothetical protein
MEKPPGNRGVRCPISLAEEAVSDEWDGQKNMPPCGTSRVKWKFSQKSCRAVPSLARVSEGNPFRPLALQKPEPALKNQMPTPTDADSRAEIIRQVGATRA